METINCIENKNTTLFPLQFDLACHKQMNKQTEF